MYQPWDNDPTEQQENYEVPDTHEGDTYEVPGDDEQETYEIVDGAEQGALIRFWVIMHLKENSKQTQKPHQTRAFFTIPFSLETLYISWPGLWLDKETIDHARQTIALIKMEALVHRPIRKMATNKLFFCLSANRTN